MKLKNTMTGNKIPTTITKTKVSDKHKVSDRQLSHWLLISIQNNNHVKKVPSNNEAKYITSNNEAK